jgi:hypothetical protein
MKTQRRGRTRAAALTGLLAVTGLVAVTAPASAAVCSNVTGTWSAQYDYAWVTDHNDDCGYMGVRHYYVAGTQSGWTTFATGTLHYYATAKRSEATAGQYFYNP